MFITIFICNNQKIAYSEDEKKRDEYYQQYGGRDYSGFTSLIEQRQNDVYEAQAKLDAAREQYERGELSEDDVYILYSDLELFLLQRLKAQWNIRTE